MKHIKTFDEHLNEGEVNEHNIPIKDKAVKDIKLT